MVDRLGDGATHDCGRAEHAVEARHRDHFNDRRNPSALRPNAPGERAAPFGLARGVGDVAHLAFQANELDAVLRAVGQPARREETGEPLRRLRESQERVAHWRRNEKLVADDLVHAIARRRCLVSFSRRSEPPCFSVIAMPMVRPVFSAARTLRGS